VVVTTVAAVPITAAVIHEIKQGENLQQIADLYGVTQEQLIAFNEIADPNKIFWGLRLRIPPVDFVPPTTTAAAPATTLAP
jgi:LysM repeat protein